jgi:hypothetical protein
MQTHDFALALFAYLARKLMQQCLRRLHQPLRRCIVEMQKLVWHLAKLNRDLLYLLA